MELYVALGVTAVRYIPKDYMSRSNNQIDVMEIAISGGAHWQHTYLKYDPTNKKLSVTGENSAAVTWYAR